MNIIDTLLESVQADAPVRRVLVGAFWTAVVLETDPPRCGLASTLRGATHDEGPPVPHAGHLLEYSGRELAGWLRSSSILEASIGAAAFNALLEPCPELRPEPVEGLAEGVDRVVCTEINAEDVILERGIGQRVAIVGHFPFVERVRRAAAECWVIELHPRPGDVPAGQAGEVLPRADVVALTGTSLINHTFDELIALCQSDAFVILLGASAPLSPVVFGYHVDAVSGTRVVDVPAALQAVGQGATFRQIPGKRLLTMMRE
ncbi:MAG: Rossmann-like domain-containing protein [Anaerolineae bacterium]